MSGDVVDVDAKTKGPTHLRSIHIPSLHTITTPLRYVTLCAQTRRAPGDSNNTVLNSQTEGVTDADKLIIRIALGVRDNDDVALPPEQGN